MSNNEELKEITFDEEDEKENVDDEEKSSSNSSEESNNGFKAIIIKEMTRIVEAYRKMMFDKADDIALIEGMNKKTDINNVINHIMNNLTSKHIYGGADEITYEYIHEYYVDNFKIIADKWSRYLKTGTIPTAPPPLSSKQQAKEEAKSQITEEQKQKYYEKALEEAKRLAKLKVEEDLKKAEAKRKAKEKLAAEKKKEAELKAKEEEEKNKPRQISLFDF